MKHPVIFDSGDPQLPNLPENDNISWSDYSNYNFSGDDSSSISTSGYRTSDHSSDESEQGDVEDNGDDQLSFEFLHNFRNNRRKKRGSYTNTNTAANIRTSAVNANPNTAINTAYPHSNLSRTTSAKSKQASRHGKHNHRRKSRLPAVPSTSNKKKNSKRFVGYFEDSFNDLYPVDPTHKKSNSNPNYNPSRPSVHSQRPSMKSLQTAPNVLQPTESHRQAATTANASLQRRDEYQDPPVLKSAASMHSMASTTAIPKKANTDHLKNRKARKARKYYESKTSSSEARKRADWEPGIDISTTKVMLSSPGSAITITDYSDTRYRVEHFEVFSEMAPMLYDFDGMSVTSGSGSYNSTTSPEDYSKDFVSDYINKVNVSKAEFGKALEDQPSWSKVRWINVNGLSWEAISLIANKYGLHRLAIEDMVDIPQRTKVDRYPGHLFAVFPLLKLIKIVNGVENNDSTSDWKSLFRFGDPSEDLFDAETTNDVDHPYKLGVDDEELVPDSAFDASKKKSKKSSLTSQIANSPMNRLSDFLFSSNSTKVSKLQFIESHRPLSYRNLTVGVEQTSLYITDTNTVISFFEHSAHEVEKSILSRLSSEKTILRDSCDPSILFQSIIDSIVDLIYPILTAYNRRLGEFEYDILINPTMSHTKELHLMMGELARLKSNIMPTSALISQLQDHTKPYSTNSNVDLSGKHKINAKNNSAPLISEATEVYLSDVYDHTISFTDDIDSLRNTIENLTNLIFNTISVNTNYSMQNLSVITVIFLPLSFWTGYYGMNFTKFGDLAEDVSYYWKIAIPFSFGLMGLIMWSSIYRTVARYQKLFKRIVGDIQERRKLKKRAQQAKKRRSIRKRFIKAFSSLEFNPTGTGGNSTGNHINPEDSGDELYKQHGTTSTSSTG